MGRECVRTAAMLRPWKSYCMYCTLYNVHTGRFIKISPLAFKLNKWRLTRRFRPIDHSIEWTFLFRIRINVITLCFFSKYHLYRLPRKCWGLAWNGFYWMSMCNVHNHLNFPSKHDLQDASGQWNEQNILVLSFHQQSEGEHWTSKTTQYHSPNRRPLVMVEEASPANVGCIMVWTCVSHIYGKTALVFTTRTTSKSTARLWRNTTSLTSRLRRRLGLPAA